MNLDLGMTTLIANVLRGDTVSVPASGFVAAYPSLFAGGASSVPVWAYTCLKDIWGMESKTDEQWEKFIVDIFGLGRAGGSTIDVSQFRVIDQADAPEGSWPKSNDIGAKMAEIHVLLKLPDNVSEENSRRLFFATQRINRLIDYNYRVNTTRTSQFKPLDSSVIRTDRDIKVYWTGEVRNDDIKSWLIQFYAFFTLTYV